MATLAPNKPGIATVLTSIASTTMNLPIVKRQIKVKGVMREIVLATILQGIVGISIVIIERWFKR